MTYAVDLEVYKDYFLAGFRHVETGETLAIEATPDSPLDLILLRRMMREHLTISFNGKRFDIPLLTLAVTGASTAQIKEAADRIIQYNLQPWEFERKYDVKIPEAWDHIDLFDVSPGVASLKIYAGRMHCKRMQELPYLPSESIDAGKADRLRFYCLHSDLPATIELYRQLLPQIQLRERMTETYGIDLRSKSDAQIAEAVLVHQVERATGQKVPKPPRLEGQKFHYRVPEFVTFKSPALRAKLHEIAAADFKVMANGSVEEPPALKGKSVTIGQGVYRLGIGGLHSSETCTAHEADDEFMLVDRDVASYYPAIILRLGLSPKSMGRSFLGEYRKIVDRRLEAKRNKDNVTADALKITINGSFGKFGSMWSRLYGPDLLIQTTVTGQLCLLMLIEMLEGVGIQVVSANTDGIVIKCRRVDEDIMLGAIAQWEEVTGFQTEETRYRGLYSRDVNNYFAVKPDGSFKLKGAYAKAGLMKNPTNAIVNEAALKWLIDGTPVCKTVRECRDLRKFVTIRQVKGGAIDQGGNYLGKAVRWYYAHGVEGVLRYKVNNYTVARTEGAKPCMELPDEFPGDVDHDWYINETLSVLADVGAFNRFA